MYGLWKRVTAARLERMVLALLLGSYLALVGCDNQYEKRKAEIWLDEIRTKEKKSQTANGMQQFVMHQNIAESSRQLLDSNILTGAERAELVGLYVNASLALAENSSAEKSTVSSEDLAKFCHEMKNDADPAVREKCELASLELDALTVFENQRVRNHIDELAAIGQRSDLGEDNAKFAELTKQIQAWWADTEATGTDHSEEMGKAINSLENEIIDVPVWVGAPQEVEIRYNQLRAHFLDNTLAKNVEFANLFSEMERIAAKSPNSLPVAQKAASIEDRLIYANQFEEAVEFAKLIVPAFASASDPGVTAIRDRIQAQAAVCEAGIEKMIHDWYRNPAAISDQAYAACAAALEKLKSMPGFSEYSADRIKALLTRAEQSYDQAVVAKVVEQIKNVLGADPTVGAKVTAFCDAAVKRGAFVGQKFELPKAESATGSLTAENMAGKWTLITFWKGTDGAAGQLLEKLDEFGTTPTYEKLQPLRVAINLDEQVDVAQQFVKAYNFKWPVLVAKAAENNQNPYAVQYAVDRSPYCVLINPEGVVEMVGLDSNQGLFRLMGKTKEKE